MGICSQSRQCKTLKGATFMVTSVILGFIVTQPVKQLLLLTCALDTPIVNDTEALEQMHYFKRNFRIQYPPLWLSSFKQLYFFRTELYLLPEGVWVGGLWEQENKLQNNPPCHTAHTDCSLLLYLPLLRIHLQQKKQKQKKPPKNNKKNPVNLMPLQRETVHAIDINVFINVSTVCIIITAMLYW